MRGRLSVIIVAALAACGPEKGDSTDETGGSTVGGSTVEEPTSAPMSVTTEPEPTSAGTETTGPGFDTSCEMFFANRDVAVGTLVVYRYGNQVETSELRIFVDGSIYHNEQTCCPPVDNGVAEVSLAPGDLMTLQANALAILAADVTEENLGPMADGQQTGLMCVLVDGAVGTVRAYEPGVDVIKRVSTAPAAADIAALVLGYTTVDMPTD